MDNLEVRSHVLMSISRVTRLDRVGKYDAKLSLGVLEIMSCRMDLKISKSLGYVKQIETEQLFRQRWSIEGVQVVPCLSSFFRIEGYVILRV